MVNTRFIIKKYTFISNPSALFQFDSLKNNKLLRWWQDTVIQGKKFRKFWSQSLERGSTFYRLKRLDWKKKTANAWRQNIKKKQPVSKKITLKVSLHKYKSSLTFESIISSKATVSSRVRPLLVEIYRQNGELYWTITWNLKINRWSNIIQLVI